MSIGWAAPVAMLTNPSPTISSASPTNEYVGIAKMLPDSRRPRRFAIVISAMTPTAISIFTGLSSGTTETIWPIAEAVETETVIT